MNMCRHHGIRMWNISREDKVCFSLYARDFIRLVPLSVKTSVRPRIVKKCGLPFRLLNMRRNWTFYSGFLLFLILLFVLSSFVWEITYNGQSSYSRETLEKTVEAMEVYPGMKRSRLDCDAIEKKIREIHPDISWVSAEEVGSVLKISIKEGKKNIVHEKTSEPTHLTAMYDGIVQQITVNRGTACVKKGQRVKKGQVLISGIVPVTDDNEEVSEKIAVSAKGEVSLLVETDFSETMSVQYPKKNYTGRKISQWFCTMGNQSFSLKNPLKRLDNSYKYDIITTVCADRVIHPLGFPVQVIKKEYREYQTKDAVYTREELKTAGLKKYQHMLNQLTENGMELVSHSAVMKQVDKNNWKLQGKITFLCTKLGTKKVTEKEQEVAKKVPEE